MPSRNFNWLEDDPDDLYRDNLYDFYATTAGRNRQRPTGLDFGGLYGGEQMRNPRREMFTEGFGTFGVRPSRLDQQTPSPEQQRYRSAAYDIPDAPKYNWDPYNRYTEYLGKEPVREDYKPKGWNRFLNAATAGVEGYRTGSPAHAIQVGEALNERPYRQAYESWKARATPYARAVELEDKRYNIGTQDWNRRVDNAHAQMQLELARDKHIREILKDERELDEKQKEKLTKGWKTELGDNGYMIIWRKNPDTGEFEMEQTPLANDRLTAAQQQANVEMREQGANRRASASRAVTREGFNRADERARLGRAQSQSQFETRESRLGDAAEQRSAARVPTNQQDLIRRRYADLLDNGVVQMIPESTAVNVMSDERKRYEIATEMAKRELNIEGMQGPNQQQLDSARLRILNRIDRMMMELGHYGWQPPNRGVNRGTGRY